MSVAENKALVTRVIEEIWNGGNHELIKDTYASDFRSHTSLPLPSRDGLEGVVDSLTTLHSAFSPYRETIEEIYAEGDRVVVRVRVRGVHSGPLGPIPATGKDVDIAEINIFRVENGRIAELRGVMELFQLFEQLGLSASPA